MQTLTTIQRLKALPLGAIVGLCGQGKQAAELFSASLTGRYEGYEQNRFRNRPGRALESVDWGLNYGIREDLLSEARALEQTFAICRRINRKYARHTVGSMRLKWATGVPDIDKAYADGWRSWMRMADVQGRHHFRKLTKIAVCRALVDGRIFAQLDRRAGFLQLQCIEGDRVSSDGIFNADRQGLFSGIGIDDNGRAKYARIWDRSLYGTFLNPKEIPFNQLVHMFDSDRFDSVSGFTRYAAVLNTVRDLRETMVAERLSAKRNSKLALLVKTTLGGATAPLVNLTLGDNPPSGGNAVSSVPNVNAISDVSDAYMFPEEEMKAHENPRPSGGWLQFMELLIREIAAGLDLPFGVVWHMAGLGGPAVRYEMNDANRTFDEFLDDVVEPMWIRPIAGAWIQLEITEGRLPFHPLWYQFSVPKPTALSIDLGRDSKAGIAENLAGLGTATDWYSENDEDFEEQTARLVHEARVREAMRTGKPYDDKLEIPLEQIRLITPNGNPQPGDPELYGKPGADAPAPEPETDDEPNEKALAR